MADLVISDTDGGCDAEGLADLPGGLARAVESVGKAVAEGCVGRGVRGFTRHRSRETCGGVACDVLVEGEVTPSAFGTGGEQAQRAGFSCAGACLQHEVMAISERFDGVCLFVCGRVQQGLHEEKG
ncbi:hypothetical protein OG476_03470 [Streptomyces sp. NBC_01396]